MDQNKILEKEIKEQQRRSEALRTIRTSDPNNPFFDQTKNGRLMRNIVANVQNFATERSLASRDIIKDIGPGRTFSKRTKIGSGSRATPTDPIHLSSPTRPAASMPPPPLPPPPPSRPHEQDMDERGSPSAPRDVEQPVDNSVEPYERPRDEEIKTRPRISETALERPTASEPSGPNTSARRLSLSHSATASKQSFPQELPAAGPRAGTPQPEPPPHPRYRIVVRKGKMVPKEWRRPGADNDESDSPSSDSE
jgi:hypothetical protein